MNRLKKDSSSVSVDLLFLLVAPSLAGSTVPFSGAYPLDRPRPPQASFDLYSLWAVSRVLPIGPISHEDLLFLSLFISFRLTLRVLFFRSFVISTLHIDYLLYEYILLKLSYDSQSLFFAPLQYYHDGSRRFYISASPAARPIYREYRPELIWYVPTITLAEWGGGGS